MALSMREVAEAFVALEKSSRRTTLVAILGDLLARAETAEMERLVYLCQGRLGPPFSAPEIGLQAKLMMHAVADATGCTEEAIRHLYDERGDIGTVAGEILPAEGRGISLMEVYHQLLAIATASGRGAQAQKIGLLADLLRRLSGPEARYVLRIAQGRLRLGVGDATILDALATSAGDPSLKEAIERCYNLSSDLGLVARVLREEGEPGLRRFQARPGRPVRPAMAQRVASPEEALRRLGRCQAEPKYDGFRLQIHRVGDAVHLFSRNMEDVSGQFPEIAEATLRQVGAESAILEGEAVGYLPETGEDLPFQVTVQRRRKHRVEAMQEAIPLRLFAFDLLYADGREFLTAPLTERRAALERLVTPTPDSALALSPVLVTDDATELERFFDEMVSEGLEGIMVKRLDGAYTAGARSFNWIKLKRGYRAELADTVDCVLVGYLYGRGQRARFGIGSLLAAVYDEKRDRFQTVAKIGSGLSDEGWVKMRELLDQDSVPHRPARVDSVLQPDVWCEPHYVVEVQADEITRSPLHAAGRDGEPTGYALRFPRMVGWIRADKHPEDATTVEEIIEMFRIQRLRATSAL